VLGNFDFEVYKFLDLNKISVTLVASDANRLGIYSYFKLYWKTFSAPNAGYSKKYLSQSKFKKKLYHQQDLPTSTK
jgi:DNA (cytosine-5)-methyltransferase 1